MTNDGAAVSATHVGMGINFVTNELWGVIADPNNTTDSNVFRVVDPTTGEIEIVNDTALTGGRSVGAAFGPCANIMFAMRRGSELYGYDVGDDTEFDYGTLVYSQGNSTDFDNLAVPYGYPCEDCVPCDLEGALAKFEFEEDEDTESYTFLLEEGSDEFVSFESFTSKEGEAYEPMTATFTTEYCELYALVKSGQELEVQSFEDIDGSVTVETANDGKYAISFVAFYCTEAAAQDAADAFGSNNGRE